MLDKDLADLYQVTTKRLNEQVKRNLKRFPGDFMLQLTKGETEILRSQIATSSSRSQFATLKRGQNIKYLPFAFTEQGVAMLSSVLNSERAVQVNIQIMRTFTKLREGMISHKDLEHKMKELEHKFKDHDDKFVVVFKVIRQLMAPPKEPEKRKEKFGF